jgi:hypothetical protein
MIIIVLVAAPLSRTSTTPWRIARAIAGSWREITLNFFHTVLPPWYQRCVTRGSQAYDFFLAVIRSGARRFPMSMPSILIVVRVIGHDGI